MKNEILLGKPNNGWVEIRIGDFKCEASYLSNIPFDTLNSAIASLENNIPFNLNIELEKEGEAFITSFYKYTYVIHEDGEINNAKLYRYNINFKDIILQFVSEIKKNANKWSVWDGNKIWDNKKEIEKSKIELLEKINKVENLLKN